MAKDQDNFEALFNEGAAPEEGEVTEDMAAGLDLEEALEAEHTPADAAQDPAQAAEEMAEGEAPEAMEPADAAPEAGMEEAPAGNEAADLEKERQRLKSWEGRLKAMDAQLKAREQAGTAGTAAPASAESPEVQAATAAMETQPIDEVMATLAEDFGDEFVSALTQVIEARAAEIAGKVADEKVGAVAGNVDQLVASLTDDKARNHFETIADAHPDFMEVAQSDAFKQWVDSLGGDKTAQAQSIIESGSARQVVKLLNDFKAANQDDQNNTMNDAAMLAAQSVRGRGGMRLPEKPQVADDYEAAWNSFS